MSSIRTDRYRDIRLLGSGGMATVTLAEDTKLGRLVALKRVHATDDPRGLTRLRREALVGASLNHPNLVSVYDVLIEDDGDLTIVMQYVAGNTLRDVIRAGRIRPPREALRILEEVASGLDAIHAQGIVHRDVKPANVLLGTDGAIKLADLGIAAVAERTQITTAGAVVGTFGYMAPEQLEGRASDPAVDIYALSAVAFEILSGHKARPEPNPLALAHAISTRPPPDLRDQWPQAPAEASAVLQRGMAFDPRNRPRSASELVRRLGAALEPETTEAMMAVPREPALPPAQPVAAPEPAAVPDRRPAPESSRRRAPISAAGAAGGAGARGAAHGAGAQGRPPAPDRPRGDRTTTRSGRGSAGGMRDRRVGLLALLAVAVAAGALVAALGSGGAGKGSSTATFRGGGTKVPRAHPSSRRRSSSSAASSAGQASASTSTSNTGSGGPAGSSGGNGSITASASPSASGASASAATPTGAVESFYENAARHNYAAAWRLADSNLRNQLRGYSSFQSQMSAVRSITFHQAQTLSGASASTATVAVRTTSQQAGRTEHCTGTVRTLRSAGTAWLLDAVSIACSS